MVFNKKEFRESILSNVKEQTGKNIKDVTLHDIHHAVSKAIVSYISDDWQNTHDNIIEKQKKQVYYFSAEFLMGRALGNNMLNFGIREEVEEVLEELGIDINEVENAESDAGLGNGGLGRLAACFLDSMATLKLPGNGYGIRYKFGMFEQKINNGYQVEHPDNWLLHTDPWEFKRESGAIYVKFGGQVDNVMDESGRINYQRNNAETVIAVPYDMPIIGFNNHHVNTLRLWEAKAPEPFDLNAFNQGDYEQAVRNKNLAENISLVLYPNDNSYSGKELRLRQQYFFTSASIQDIINNYCYTYGEDKLSELHEKVAIQLNDTHPVIAIPELMRVLMDWKNFGWDEAWNITTKVFSYTNHTVLAEALESWPIDTFRTIFPRIYQIVEEINRRFLSLLSTKYAGNNDLHYKLSILHNGKIYMANLAIVGSHKINGVAYLHTEILKKDVLKEWYMVYPEKFINKTNGITPRRWIMKSNPRLTALIDKKIGCDWKKDLMELKKLVPLKDDKKFLESLAEIKQKNKNDLAEMIKEWTGVELDPHSIFDVQVKRLHEYKRQLLNILHVIYLYHKIKNNPNLEIHAQSFIFGGKAAAGYWRAKSIIKLINNVAKVINSDPIVSEKIRVVFIPNYRVSVAEKIFPGSDVSEQISTAGKEASGTGNMKFMANGAITIGTLDGANVEILEEVGAENCVIFGATSDELSKLFQNRSYNPWDIYQFNPDIKRTLDSLVDGTFTVGENSQLFVDIFNSLLYSSDSNHPDTYFVLKDFFPYVEAQQKINNFYQDKDKWIKMSLMNIACCGKFSSDRTIQEYASEIWNIQSIS